MEEAEFTIFSRYSEIALEKADEQYELSDEDPNIVNLLGEIYRFKTMASAAAGSALDAFWHAKKAVGYYEDAIDLDSLHSQAYLGVGFFKYALSFVPGVFDIAITLSGLSGDKAEGLLDMKKSYELSGGSNIEAAFLLAKIYIEYNAEYELADDLLTNLVNEYPDNYLFLYQFAILKLEQRKIDDAEIILKHIVSINSKELTQTVALSHFLLAENSYKKKKYIEAIDRYDIFLKFTRSIDYTGLAYLNKAVSHLMINEELEAKRDLLYARNGNLEIPDDNFAKEMSEHLFNSLPDSSELKIISAWNDISAGDYETAEETALQTQYYELRNEFKGLRQIVLAECYIKSKKYVMALEELQFVKEMEYEFNRWLEPYTYYLIARVYFVLNNSEVSRENVLIAEDLNTHNYKNRLEALINYLKNRLFEE